MVAKGLRRKLQFLATGAACSDGLSIHCHSEDAEQVGYAIADWLIEHASTDDDGWNELELDGVHHGDPAIAALVQRMVQRDIWCQSESRMNCWFLKTARSVDSYLADFGRTRRRQFRQHQQRLQSEPDLSLAVVSDQNELNRELASLIDLHQRRWNAVGQPGTYADPRFCEFVKEAATLKLMRDRLRLVSLKHQNQTIAAQLQLISSDKTLSIYSSGMSPEHAAIEPGRILDVNTIVYASEQGLPGIDYLRGNEPYKANLHAVPTPLVRIKAFSSRRLGRLERRLYQTAFEAKQWVRRQRGSQLIQILSNLHATKIHQPSPSTAAPQTIIQSTRCHP